MVPPIEQSDKKIQTFSPRFCREIYTRRRRRRALSVKHSLLKWLRLFFFLFFAHRPTKCKYGGHIHKRKKERNKVNLISNMSPTPKRKKSFYYLLYKVHGTWGGGGEYPTGFWPHMSFPNHHHHKVGVVVVDEHQRKKESVCANNKCRTSPHHMAPKSFIIMQSWMHGVSPKCLKRVV
jgi:hypothetical protein